MSDRTLIRLGAILLAGAVCAWSPTRAMAQDGRPVSTTGACSPIVIDAGGTVTKNINCPITLSERQLAQLNEAIAKAALNQAALTGPLLQEVKTLSGELKVQRSALENFFRILKKNNVAAGNLDSALRQIATRHLELSQRLATSAQTDDPEIRDTLAAAKAAIERGDYDRADALLAEPEERDLRAIARQQEELDARKLRAAETRAERGELNLIKFAYLEAGRHFAGAARIVPSHHPLTVARYANMAGQAFHDGAAYARAEEHFTRSLSLRERNLEPDDPEIAPALNNLALLHLNTGRYAEAEPLMQRALAINEAALGSNHPTVATNLNNLADLYTTTGRYAEAEPLFQRALAVSEAALGPNHPTVASGLNNLADLYRITGRYAEAEPFMERALAIGEATFGPNHPTVAINLSNLASVYYDTGRYAAAEPLLYRALAIDESALGPNHPAVAFDLNNLANLYYAIGRRTEAEPFMERALAIFERSLGSEHPHTRTVRANLQVLRGGN